MLSILNVRSHTHNSCEDSVYTREDEKHIIGIVADGCSTGIKSHFASQLICYIAQNSLGLEVTKDYSVKMLRGVMLEARHLIGLGHMNLLSTILLFNYNKITKQLNIRAFGDGFYSVNDEHHDIDQGNIPDYLGYHLMDNNKEFHEFLDKYPEITYHNVDKFMVCSDGIHSISRSQFAPASTLDPKILFQSPASANYLQRMWNKLSRDHYICSDDLTIVSYG